VGVTAPGELLCVDSVTKTYSGHRLQTLLALDGVSFAIGHGEFVSIVGPSGCGKSTLLRLAAGLDFPSSGRVLFENRPVEKPGKQRALVFQAYSAFPWLTVRENIAFGLHNPAESAEKVDKWLAVTGLTEFADAYPKGLSGGMRQRLAIARAMIVEPSLLLLDEPFGALDDRTRDSMRTLLISTAGETGCSVILVTHDIREAILLADRVILLTARPGKIIEIVPSTLPKPRTRHLLGAPEFDALYQSLSEKWESGDKAVAPPETVRAILRS
jgi:NitT/TauT family transport system ATP-binding protein